MREMEEAVRTFQFEFGKHFGQFNNEEQQCAYEFLSCLLQGLNEDLNTAPKFGEPLPEETVMDRRTEASQLFTKRTALMKERDHSQIS